jgi:hypothetical protein
LLVVYDYELQIEAGLQPAKRKAFLCRTKIELKTLPTQTVGKVVCKKRGSFVANSTISAVVGVSKIFAFVGVRKVQTNLHITHIYVLHFSTPTNDNFRSRLLVSEKLGRKAWL